MDWLVQQLNKIPIEFLDLKSALWLQFCPLTDETDLLSAVWLVGETIQYTWARRKNREITDTNSLTTTLLLKAYYMSHSAKHSWAGKNLTRILSQQVI